MIFALEWPKEKRKRRRKYTPEHTASKSDRPTVMAEIWPIPDQKHIAWCDREWVNNNTRG